MSEDIRRKIKDTIQLLQTDNCNVSEALRDLQELLRAASGEQIASILEEMDLNSLFGNMDNWLLSPVKRDCIAVFSLVLDQLSPDYVFSHFNEEIKAGLTSKSEEVRLLWLKVLNRCCDSSTAVNSFANKGSSSDTISLLIELLGDGNETIAKFCNSILLKLARNQTIHVQLFSEDCKQSFTKMMKLNDVVRFRVYDLMIALSLMSVSLLNKVDEAGYLSQMLQDSNGDDPLVVLNCVQLLSDLALQPHGVDYLHNSGYLRIFTDKLSRPSADSMFSLILPGFLKLMGTVARVNPDLIATDYHEFFDVLGRLSEDSNGPTMPTVIDTIAIIGKSLDGKKVLQNKVSQFPSMIKQIGRILLSSSGELKCRALNCLASLLQLDQADPNGEGATITETWYNDLAPNSNVTSAIISSAKQPFLETRLAALVVIKSLAAHLWGQKKLAAEEGFIEYLLNRSTEFEKTGKEAKYNIVTELVTSPFVAFAFNRETVARIKRYHREGPFFVETETAVAVEGSR